MDYINRILYESIRNVLLENRESKNINLARKFLKSKGYNDENAQKILDGIRTDIPNSRLAQCKFLLGVSRLYIERQLNDGLSIHTINKLLPYIASEAHVNEYDNNLNNLSLNDINSRFSSVKQQDNELSRKNSYSKQHIKNNEYSIVRIPDFETASKYSKYTSWCVTHHKSMYDSYTHNGLGLFYFCLKSGFENVEQKQGENAPLDEYGLSMIAVSVDEEGEVNTITSRWNHDMEGNDHIMSKDELEDLLGVNFYDTFKPYTDEELLKKGYVTIKKIREIVADGQDLSNILKFLRNISNHLLLFANKNDKYILYNTKSRSIPDWITNWIDNIDYFHYNLFKIKLNDKWSIIDTEGNLIGNGKLWFDWVYDFDNDFAVVELNKKYSFIDANGNLIGDGKMWFDNTFDFKNGFAAVKLNGKYSFIDTNGNLIGNGNAWFDIVDDFINGFASVKLNGKYSFIDTNGNLIGDGNAWFDDAEHFENGFASVKLNGKYSFIDTNGNLIGNGNAWFDDVCDFKNGFAYIKLNDEWFYIDKNLNFYDIRTNKPIKSPFSNESSNESIDNVGKILRECINNYLNRKHNT